MGARKKRSYITCVVKFFCAVFIFLVFSILGLFIADRIYINVSNARNDITRMEYRTDIEPLQRRFPHFDNSHETFWKTGICSKGFFPPARTDIWLKGFVILSPTDFYALEQEANWIRTEKIFEEGMYPSVTGFDRFDWHSSWEMSSIIRRESRYRGFSYRGSFYLDKINRVLYFFIFS